MIIALSGAAGAGKDSVANVLVERHGFVLYSLSGPVKRFAEDMFGFTKEQLYGPSSARSTHNPKWELECPACSGGGEDSSGVCIRCHGAGQTEVSVRSTLVPLGTEYLRDMVHPDCLSIRASWDLRKMQEAGLDVVVNDARYRNDRDNLHDLVGAFRVDVRAPGKKPKADAWRRHPSELDRPADEHVEWIIQNVEKWPFPGLPAEVERMLIHLRHV